MGYPLSTVSYQLIRWPGCRKQEDYDALLRPMASSAFVFVGTLREKGSRFWGY